MKKSSWGCTIFIQLSLCLIVYVSLHFGHQSLLSSNDGDNAGALDLHFISVSGGFRPLQRQTRLLRLVCVSSHLLSMMKVWFFIEILASSDWKTESFILIRSHSWFHQKGEKCWFFFCFFLALLVRPLQVRLLILRILYVSLVDKRLLYWCCAVVLMDEDGESCGNLQG